MAKSDKTVKAEKADKNDGKSEDRRSKRRLGV